MVSGIDKKVKWSYAQIYASGDLTTHVTVVDPQVNNLDLWLGSGVGRGGSLVGTDANFS